MPDWKKLFNKYYKKVLKKGNERLTLMIIPHTESNIINLHLSKFAVAFSVFIFFALILTSIVSMGLQKNMSGEVDELTGANKAFLNERTHYIIKYNELYKLNQQIKEKVRQSSNRIQFFQHNDSAFLSDKDLMHIAKEDIAMENRQIQDGSRNFLVVPENANDNLSKSFRYGNEVVHYRKLHLDMQQTISSLNSLSYFLKNRERVQRTLPYGWVMRGGHFTSFFGPRMSPFGYTRDFHAGVDIAEKIGTPIYAAGDGLVVAANYSGGYGNRVRIQHSYGYTTLYGHMSSIGVRHGQYVKKGQFIGRVGATGRVTGPHLHYEVHYGNKPIDPLPFLTSS